VLESLVEFVFLTPKLYHLLSENFQSSIKDEISGTERQLNDRELASARSTASKVQNEIEDKSRTKAGQEGRNRGFSEQVARLKRELNSDMFKDAQTTYHHQNIKCHVGQQTAKDMDMFITSYQRAIMRFHSDKMQEINRTLRELWVEIYRYSQTSILRASILRGPLLYAVFSEKVGTPNYFYLFPYI
jgi:DNA repair protein RAD50